MARRQAIGSKYSIRLDESVSGDLHKLKGRLATAKAELSAIRADVVLVTSPIRRTPPDQPRVTAVPPKSTAMPRPPPRRPPVYTLRPSPPTHQPVVRAGPGLGVPVGRGPTTAARKRGAGTKQQPVTKTEAMQVDSRPGRQTAAAVSKPLTKPAATRAVRPGQQTKPSATAHRRPQPLAQRRAPPVQTSARRQTAAGTAKVARATNTDAAAARKQRDVKKRLQQTATSASARPQDGAQIFPADVDTQYTMKKFMAQRESEFSVSTTTMPQKPSVSHVDRVISEVAQDVAEVVDQLQVPLHVSANDQTHQSTWLEFPVNVDQLPNLIGEATTFGDIPQPPTTTPLQSDSHFKGSAAADEEKPNVHIGKTSTSYVDRTSTIIQNEHANKDDDVPARTSAAKHETVKSAMNIAEKRASDGNVKTKKEADEVLVEANTETGNGNIPSESAHEKVQAMQSNKFLVEVHERARSRENLEREPAADRSKFANVEKDEDQQAVHHTVHVEEKDEETGYEAQNWAGELQQDGGRESSVSVYDDHHTLPDDDVYGVLPVSADIPMSNLSDNDPELAALSATSNVSHRDLTNPAFDSPTDDVEATEAAAIQNLHTWKYANDDDAHTEVVKVVEKERKPEIIVDVGNTKRRGDEAAHDDEEDGMAEERSKSTGSSMSGDDETLKAGEADAYDDDDDEEIYLSGSDNEEEDELVQLASRQQNYLQEDSDKVDGGIKTRNLSDNENKDVLLAHKNDELKHGDDGALREVGKKSMEEAIAEDAAGSTADEQISNDTFQRIRSDDGFVEHAERDGEKNYPADNFIPAPIGGVPNYLEEEYGLPSLTPLDRDEELEGALRGEGPPIYHDEETVGLYSLGEDGLPDFSGEYSLGIGAERLEEKEMTAVTQDDAMSKLINMKKPERMDDEVSILPDAAQSEEWDDALYALSNPASRQLRETEAGAAPEMMADVVANRQGTDEKTAIIA